MRQAESCEQRKAASSGKTSRLSWSGAPYSEYAQQGASPPTVGSCSPGCPSHLSVSRPRAAALPALGTNEGPDTLTDQNGVGASGAHGCRAGEAPSSGEGGPRARGGGRKVRLAQLDAEHPRDGSPAPGPRSRGIAEGRP